MPAIQRELRVQIEGGQAPLLVRRSSLQVNSCEQISLFVDGVKPDENKPQNKNSNKSKPQRRVMTATYTPRLANVKFVAIYDAGQANGLRVKIGHSKLAPLNQPMLYMDRAAAIFGSKPTIVLENESGLPRTAMMLVGSDLPKEARKIELVKTAVPVAKRTSKTTQKKSSTKRKQ
jgi:hypothetical protein